jgi:hypothetical protein
MCSKIPGIGSRVSDPRYSHPELWVPVNPVHKNQYKEVQLFESILLRDLKSSECIL